MNELRHTTAIEAKSLNTTGLPDGVIAEFTAVLTTSKLDRDKDVMHTDGAEVDPSMPLLWQHDPDRPIGKFAGLVERTGKRIVAKFHLADLPLAKDALVLLRMGALRISHGFKPSEAEPNKSGGFDVRKWLIVEASVVSVPANEQAVVLALNEGKLTTPLVKSWAGSLVRTKDDPMPTETKTPEPDTKAAKYTDEDVQTIVGKALDDFAKRQTPDEPGDGTTPDEVLAASKSASGVRVKRASERYSTTKSTGRHVKTGEPVRNEFGREVELPSESEHARAGAFLKHLAHRAGIGGAALDDHGRELLADTFEHDRWCGAFGGGWKTGIEGTAIKSLLNDSVSGGAEAVPEFFDADLIQFPLLHGELFPHIDLRPVPRGAAVETASVGNPTVQWNVADGTEIPLFDTSALIAAIDTTIHTVTVAVEVGRDFLSDSPADVGRILLENIGQRLQAELDRVVAVGNGTSEPEGIFTASGTTSVNSDNGASGPPTLADYESLLFGIGKQYRNASMRPAFITNDTSYQRRTGIKIDPAVSSTDQRPVFGMTHNDYSTLGWSHRVQNDIANTKQAFVAMAKYRMYRRMGMSVEWAMGGKELTRRNLAMLVVRARFGGQLVDTNAAAVIADAQS